MAKYLYKLASLSVRNRKKVIFGTIGILIVLIALVANQGLSFVENVSIPNTPADKASKVIEEEFHTSQVKTNAKVKIVFKAPKFETLVSNESNSKITAVHNDIKKDPTIEKVSGPLELNNLSNTKRIGYAEVSYNVTSDNFKESSKNILLESIKTTKEAGIQTELTGPISFTDDSASAASHSIEAVGVIIAYVILAITFVSFLAAGLPIITAIIGLVFGILIIGVGTQFIEFQSVSLSLAGMLGIAVGIDYALFIITRFKQQLAKGSSVQESIAIAIGTAGSAVVFAGLTVIIGLLGLAVTKIPFLTMMGVAAAISILTSVLISIIVLPAILGMVGHKIGPSKNNRFLHKITQRKAKKSDSNKWGNFVTKRPMLLSLVLIGLLVTCTVPFFHMNLGLPTDGTQLSQETTERRAYDLLTEGYGEGIHSSLVVVARTNEVTDKTPQDINKIQQELSELSGVKNVSPAIPAASKKAYMIRITPETGPNDTETKELVNTIRGKSEKTLKDSHIELLVTGISAVNIDIAQKLNDALPVFASLIVGLAYMILVLVFRSLLIPLKAVLGFLLSLGATFGFVVYVVQDNHLLDLFGFPAPSPILAFLPVNLIGILFGLAMDYEIFLVSKMREVYVHTGDPRKAILEGMKGSGKVVTAAGLIMVAVFIGFMMTPDPTIKVIAMSLAFGVFIDAFVVRMTLVPAVMMLMGKSAWYLPKWLDKLLPNIDIEGDTIMKQLYNKNNDESVTQKNEASIINIR
ncbi:MMPL family transporter [Metabacillus halosaccharovorans]|uniref:MMPL family transporter n=1 Tax=Metabacillus halosaccharovorans TaxID=930124 RepID=UPI001C1FC7B1|nr:MMPL family transporter [Metabacillus halosaccharovorans]MBU7591106.1 MMPL family transporter [Metabacillus halosaccharovorans]